MSNQLSPKAAKVDFHRNDLDRDDVVLDPQRDGPAMDHESLRKDDQKDKQINELSDMVKELLKEQKELKYQLDATTN